MKKEGVKERLNLTGRQKWRNEWREGGRDDVEKVE